MIERVEFISLFTESSTGLSRFFIYLVNKMVGNYSSICFWLCVVLEWIYLVSEHTDCLSIIKESIVVLLHESLCLTSKNLKENREVYIP